MGPAGGLSWGSVLTGRSALFLQMKNWYPFRLSFLYLFNYNGSVHFSCPSGRGTYFWNVAPTKTIHFLILSFNGYPTFLRMVIFFVLGLSNNKITIYKKFEKWMFKICCFQIRCKFQSAFPFPVRVPVRKNVSRFFCAAGNKGN